MNIIFDNQFAYIYVLKVVVIGMIYVSGIFAEKIFSEMYMKAVYANNVDPPNILTYYGIFLGFNAAFCSFLFAILYILTLVMKSPMKSFFAINTDLMFRFLIDLAIFFIISGLLIIVVGQMIQVKKYFKYKTEGLSALRAYRELAFYISSITIILPYFLMV